MWPNHVYVIPLKSGLLSHKIKKLFFFFQAWMFSSSLYKHLEMAIAFRQTSKITFFW